MKKILFAVVALLLFFASCQSPKEECAYVPETSSIKIDLDYQALEDSLLVIQTKQQLVDFFSRHSLLRDVFFNRQGYPSDSAFINELFHRFTNPSFDTLLSETKKVFGDGVALKQEFTQAFIILKYYYPDFQVPRIETVITGLESDLFVSDTLIIVGLDYYLGSGAKYRPNMYEYMLRRYTKDFVVPSAMLLYGIDSRINLVTSTDKSVLADMIAYGKAYHFAKQMLPCVADSIFIGYSAEEIAGAKVNQGQIWKRLIADEVFFNTSQLIKQKYISERPKTIEVGDQCPGRIGMWMGWQIVDAYRKRNPKTTLPELMKISDAQLIFKESKYRPE
jgi:hypothetical protein